jgi:cobalt transporter subunit CbtB
MLTSKTALSPAANLTTQQRMAAGALALVFGVFLLFGAGFAHSNTLHNAAHDTRHALGFPCH